MSNYLDKINALVDPVEDWSRLPAEPLVSVWMITYNHEPFIRQALNSVLMQEVNFDYEVVIGEDKSTDRTREIVEEYQRRHPDKIRLRLARENLYSQKLKPGLGVLAACRGKYIAMCEGDDYWTDPLKLQKQVEIFRKHPDCIFCGGRARTWNEAEGRFTFVTPREDIDAGCLTPHQYFDMCDWVKTCTRMVPRELILGVPIEYQGDCLTTHYLLATNPKGVVRCLEEFVAVYREHAGGVCSGATQTALMLESHHASKMIRKIYRDRRFDRYQMFGKRAAQHLMKDPTLRFRERCRYALSFVMMDIQDFIGRRPCCFGRWLYARWILIRYAAFPGRSQLKRIVWAIFGHVKRLADIAKRSPCS
jgi:glycosyltransferase involved in cell wall biosynthesis